MPVFGGRLARPDRPFALSAGSTASSASKVTATDHHLRHSWGCRACRSQLWKCYRGYGGIASLRVRLRNGTPGQ